jgi:aldehyde dehydrogenase (NAD+)
VTIHAIEKTGSSSVLTDLRRVFATGRTRPLEWRLEQLRGIERLVDEREADIAAALAADLGRSAAEAWLGDVASTKGEAVYALKNVKKWMHRRREALPLAQLPGRAWVQYDPLGVVLIIGPWNYPLYLSLAPLVAAVAAGNCAVIKPSELAPATSADSPVRRSRSRAGHRGRCRHHPGIAGSGIRSCVVHRRYRGR